MSISAFAAHLEQAFQAETLVKLTLSKPRLKTQALTNLYAKRVLIKNAPMLSLTYRYPQRDEVKNLPLAEFLALLPSLLTEQFSIATLLTTQNDFQLELDKHGAARLKTTKPSQTQAPKPQHDKQKQHRIAPSAEFLIELGISSKQGQVHAAHQDKYRQINRYVELLEPVLQALPEGDSVRIVDMGCGKGYLTFALYAHLAQNLGKNPQIVGVELRPNLVDQSNQLAQKLGFGGLRFAAANIQDYTEPFEVLIALHACDTATDLAIFKGISANARAVVVAPCCHKQIRAQMQCTSALQAVLKYGILEERQAELLTDGIRARILEGYGYKTRVAEFVSLENTPKNLLITAVRTGEIAAPKPEFWSEIEEIKRLFGIQTHALESLLLTPPLEA